MSRLVRKSNITENKGPGYENSYGQVTPFHILFKDFGNEIAALPKEHAVEFVINKIRQLNQQNTNDPEYAKIPEENLKDLKDELLSADYDSGMDILFAIKDKLLEAEGAEAKEEPVAEEATEQPETTVQETPVEEQPQEQTIEEPVQPDPATQPAETTPEQPVQASVTLKRLIRKNV
ncbi:MAG: hypothetical protein K0R18_291 [Bacillales bacterium]|jgi:outer membrane biosynthesis protein TonB|nr:hypothetical protein [Bacillales bacterium]